MGYEADDLLKISEPLNEVDIFQYKIPEFTDIAKLGIRGIYLETTYYGSRSHSEKMVKKYNVSKITR